MTPTTTSRLNDTELRRSVGSALHRSRAASRATEPDEIRSGIPRHRDRARDTIASPRGDQVADARRVADAATVSTSTAPHEHPLPPRTSRGEARDRAAFEAMTPGGRVRYAVTWICTGGADVVSVMS